MERGQQRQAWELVGEQDRQRLHEQAFGETGEGLHEREVRQRYGVSFSDDGGVLERVCDALTDDPELDASGVEVAVEQGVITLSGVVHSSLMKARAVEIASGVAGVRRVEGGQLVEDARR